MSYITETNILMFLNDTDRKELLTIQDLDWFVKDDGTKFFRLPTADIYYCYVKPEYFTEVLVETNLYVPTIEQYVDTFYYQESKNK